MGRYFSVDYTGGAFELFGPAHLWTSVLLALAFYLLIRQGRKDDAHARRITRRGIAGFMIVLEAASHWFWAAGGAWTVEVNLPLHMCGAMTLVSAWALWFDKRAWYPLVYFLGLGGAVQAIVTPDAGVYGFPHFRFFEALLSHAVLVLGGLWVVLVERASVRLKDLLVTFGGLNAYALLMYFFNRALGSNYLFVNGKPDTASAMDLMPEWPYYILVLETLVIALFTLMFVPFWWRENYGTPAGGNVSAH